MELVFLPACWGEMRPPPNAFRFEFIDQELTLFQLAEAVQFPVWLLYLNFYLFYYHLFKN